MKKRPNKPRKASRPRAVLLTVAVLVVLGLGGWWLWPEASAGGTPKLALDRTEIDLGYLRFSAPAHAAFTITNTGDGLLTLKPGRVRVVQGC